MIGYQCLRMRFIGEEKEECGMCVETTENNLSEVENEHESGCIQCAAKVRRQYVCFRLLHK